MFHKPIYFTLGTILCFAAFTNANDDLDDEIDSIACGGWAPYNGEKCFEIIFEAGMLTFEEAEQACEAQGNGAELVSIHSDEEQQFVEDFLFNTRQASEDFWLGATYSHLYKKYSWIDGTEFDYTHWYWNIDKEPNTCVEMKFHVRFRGKWLDVPCNKRNLVLCQRVLDQPEPTERPTPRPTHRPTPPPDNECPEACQEQISELRDDVEELKSKIKKDERRIKVMEDKMDNLEELESRVEKNERDIEKLKKQIPHNGGGDDQDLRDKVRTAEQKIKTLEQKFENMEDIPDRIDQNEKEIDKLKKIISANGTNNGDQELKRKVKTNEQKIKTLESKFENLDDIIDMVNGSEKTIQTIEDSIKLLESQNLNNRHEFDDVWRNINNMLSPNDSSLGSLQHTVQKNSEDIEILKFIQEGGVPQVSNLGDAEHQSSLDLIPINFIYIQLPNQKSPEDLWPILKWKDVTKSYAGLFFRAEGDSSAPFGQLQEQSWPRIDQVQTVHRTKFQAESDPRPTKVQLDYSERWSTSLYVSHNRMDNEELNNVIQFHTTEDEVRPRNLAIRFWKRVD